LQCKGTTNFWDNQIKMVKVFAKDFAISKERVINDYQENYTMEVCVNKYYDVYKQLYQKK
jgi:hypothetical protein